MAADAGHEEGRSFMGAKAAPVRAIRALPAQPNLEHLKHEAKQRLRQLRTGDPSAKLAAAQLALARDYGFASWRKLKSHGEPASAPRPARGKVVAAGGGRANAEALPGTKARV